MTDLTKALALDASETENGTTCDHVWKRDHVCANDGATSDVCLVCGIRWADAMRGFGSNHQPLAPGMRRVVRA
jgi:hypothetical protein